MHLQDMGNRFIVVDKQTDHEKENEVIERSPFLKIDYDPTILVHELVEPKKWVFGSGGWTQYNIDF